MKVDGSLQGTALPGATNQVPPRTKTTVANTVGQDSVSLSDASSQMQSLEASVKQASGFDASKVEAVKQAISEGRFTINAEQIADNLIASTRELIARQKS